MYELIAHGFTREQNKVGGDFEMQQWSKAVALFAEATQAEEYIRKAKLTKPIRQTYGNDLHFRKDSLLSQAEYATIAPHHPLPINPTI